MLVHGSSNMIQQLFATLLENVAQGITLQIEVIVGIVSRLLLILLVLRSASGYFSLESQGSHKFSIIFFVGAQVAIAIFIISLIFLLLSIIIILLSLVLIILSFLLLLPLFALRHTYLTDAYLGNNDHYGEREEKQSDRACNEQNPIDNFGLFDEFGVLLTGFIFQIVHESIAKEPSHDYEHHCEHYSASSASLLQVPPRHRLLLTATAEVNSEDAVHEGRHNEPSVETFEDLQTFASLSLSTLFVSIGA